MRRSCVDRVRPRRLWHSQFLVHRCRACTHSAGWHQDTLGELFSGCLGSAASTRERLLQEYVASADQAEAERCLRELAVPFFHHELVKQALLAAMEAPAAQRPLLALLARMADSGLVSGSQMQKARLPQRSPWCMSCVAGGASAARAPR